MLTIYSSMTPKLRLVVLPRWAPQCVELDFLGIYHIIIAHVLHINPHWPGRLSLLCLLLYPKQ